MLGRTKVLKVKTCFTKAVTGRCSAPTNNAWTRMKMFIQLRWHWSDMYTEERNTGKNWVLIEASPGADIIMKFNALPTIDHTAILMNDSVVLNTLWVYYLLYPSMATEYTNLHMLSCTVAIKFVSEAVWLHIWTFKIIAISEIDIRERDLALPLYIASHIRSPWLQHGLWLMWRASTLRHDEGLWGSSVM